MVEQKITNPAQWKEIRPNPYDQHVDLTTVYKIDKLVAEWTRLHFLAYQSTCKARHRLKRIRIEQEYCNAINGYIDYLNKQILWSSLKSS